MPTPWAEYATRSQESFMLKTTPLGLMITGGPNTQRYPAMIVDARGRIQLTPPRTGVSEFVPAYELSVRPWKKRGSPHLHLHPFALAHLWRSKQLSRSEVEAVLAQYSGWQKLITFRPTQSSELARKLETSRVLVTLATCYDFKITR